MIHRVPEDAGNHEEKNMPDGPHALYFNLQQKYLLPHILHTSLATLYTSGSINDKDLQMISIFFSTPKETNNEIDKRIYMQQPQHLGFMKLISALADTYSLDTHIGKQFIQFLQDSQYADTYIKIDTQQFEQYRQLTSSFSQERKEYSIEDIHSVIDMYDTHAQTKFLSFLVHRFDTQHIGLIQPQFSHINQDDIIHALDPIKDTLGAIYTDITKTKDTTDHIEKYNITQSLLKELTYIYLLSRCMSAHALALTIDICAQKGIFSVKHSNIYINFFKTHKLVNEKHETTDTLPSTSHQYHTRGSKRISQFIDMAYEIQYDTHTLISNKQHVYLSHVNKSGNYKDDYTAINKQLQLPEKIGILPTFVYIRHALTKTDTLGQVSTGDDVLTDKGIQDILDLASTHILSSMQHAHHVFSGNLGPTEQTAILYAYSFGTQSKISNHNAWGNTDKHKPDNYVNGSQYTRTKKIDAQMAAQNLEDFFRHLCILHSICYTEGIVPIITHGSPYKYIERSVHKEPSNPDNLSAIMLPRYQSQNNNDTNFFHLEHLKETLTRIQRILDSFGICNRYIPEEKINIQKLHDTLKGKIDKVLDTDYELGKELVHVLYNTSTAPGIKNRQLYNYIHKYWHEIVKSSTVSDILKSVKTTLLSLWKKS